MLSNDDFVTLEVLQKLKIYVAYSPLSSTSFQSQDYTSWFVTRIEGVYSTLFSGSLLLLETTSASPNNSTTSSSSTVSSSALPLSLAIEVHDAAEPLPLLLTEFHGPIHMLYGIILGGLGFLSTCCYMPWMFCTVYKNALKNKGLPPLFFRSSRQFRGW